MDIDAKKQLWRLINSHMISVHNSDLARKTTQTKKHSVFLTIIRAEKCRVDVKSSAIPYSTSISTCF